jgi:hypothetical protein
MDRRDALKALTLLAGSTGLTVTPVTTREAGGVELVVLKAKGRLSAAMQLHLRDSWTAGVQGTALEQTRAIIVDDALEIEFVRTRG